jgi:hypothetical protein
MICLSCLDMICSSILLVYNGAVLKVLESLIAFVNEVNDRPVGNPKSKV